VTRSTAALSAQSPAEIDGQLYPILDRIAKLYSSLHEYKFLLGEECRIDGHGKERWNDPGVQRTNFEESLADTGNDIAKAEHEALPYEEQWERRRWTRYIVVPGGHLHFRQCHTLTPGRTMIGQVAEASGLTPVEVIAKYDATACTHCFPDAPVAPKKTPAEEGFCGHSGQPMTQAQRDTLNARYPSGWHNFAVARTVRCECGAHVSITKTDKIRKHKPGSQT